MHPQAWVTKCGALNNTAAQDRQQHITPHAKTASQPVSPQHDGTQTGAILSSQQASQTDRQTAAQLQHTHNTPPLRMPIVHIRRGAPTPGDPKPGFALHHCRRGHHLHYTTIACTWLWWVAAAATCFKQQSAAAAAAKTALLLLVKCTAARPQQGWERRGMEVQTRQIVVWKAACTCWALQSALPARPYVCQAGAGAKNTTPRHCVRSSSFKEICDIWNSARSRGLTLMLC